jgi:hypothetical protein
VVSIGDDGTAMIGATLTGVVVVAVAVPPVPDDTNGDDHDGCGVNVRGSSNDANDDAIDDDDVKGNGVRDDGVVKDDRGVDGPNISSNAADNEALLAPFSPAAPLVILTGVDAAIMVDVGNDVLVDPDDGECIVGNSDTRLLLLLLPAIVDGSGDDVDTEGVFNSFIRSSSDGLAVARTNDDDDDGMATRVPVPMPAARDDDDDDDVGDDNVTLPLLPARE